MMEFTIKITPQFYILNGIGSGDLQHDSCFKETDQGIPYLSGTSLKGILRESMMEVLEMTGDQDALKTCNDYFGRSGSFKNNSKIQYISNAYPEWKSELETDIKLNNGRPPFTKKLISNYFAAKFSQISIKDGVAVTGSLRTAKVLDHLKVGSFLCNIYFNEGVDEKLIRMTLLNASYMGENRNRGLGEIKMVIEEIKNQEERVPTNISPLERIKYRITTLAPVIMSTQKGDENIINTETYILGSKILGALASRYTKKYMNEEFFNQDATFTNLFINGSLIITSGLPENAIVLPLNIQENKTIKGQYFDCFDDSFADLQGVVKQKYYTQQNLFEVSKSQVFHNSRVNRTAGASQDDDEAGSIFYYESLDENQTFEGYIEGSSNILTEFLSKFAKEEIISIGTSKSVKYGLCKITFEPIPVPVASSLAQYLIFQTPCILFNEYLESEVNYELIKSAIGYDIETMFIKTEEIKSYNTQWGGNTPSHIAIKPGSVIKLATPTMLKEKFQIGQYKERGFGEIRSISQETLSDIIGNITIKNKLSKTNDRVNRNTNLPNSEIGLKIFNKYKNSITGDYRNITNKISLTNSEIENLLTNIANKREDEWLKFLETIMQRPLGIKLISFGVFENFRNKKLIDGERISDFSEYSGTLIKQLKQLRLRNA